MIIAVISPHTRHNGNTITSSLLALGLGSMNKKVLLTHSNAISNSFYTYFGLEQYEDKTTTPTQLVKLLREGAIQPEAISDYCKEINDGVFLFTNNKTNFSDEDMLEFSDFVMQLSDYDFIIYDIENTESPTASAVLKNADVVIINVTQSILELQELKNIKENLMKRCKGKQVVLVCNKFSSVIGKEKDISKSIGEKTECQVIHYNPWIPFACNSGKLIDLYKTIKSKGLKVIELDKDILRLSTLISKAKIRVSKQKLNKNNISTSNTKVGGAAND